MAYVLVPKGFELKKVTVAQKKAVTEYYLHENITKAISNPFIPAIIGGVAIAGFTLLKIQDFVAAFSWPEFPDVAGDIKKFVLDPVTIDQSEKPQFLSDIRSCISAHPKINLPGGTAVRNLQITACMIGKGWTSEIIGEGIARAL